MQENILRKKGLKTTESRKIILKVLSNQREPLTADAIFHEAKMPSAEEE